jgi:sugar phosphate isomerase/epimerase
VSRLLSLAAGTILDVGPADAVSVAADAGWPAVGIWFDPATWTAQVGRDVRQRLDSTGVIALDMEPVILTSNGDPGDALIDAAVSVGARHVLVASRNPDLVAVVDRFGVLCDRAAPAGIIVVLEFLPIFPVAILAMARQIVATAERSNSGVLVDSLHLARSGAEPADVAGPGFPYLQMADATAVPVDSTPTGLRVEALDGRLLPGDGALPLAELAERVPGVPLSFELRSARLRTSYPDARDRARAVLAAWTRLAIA